MLKTLFTRKSLIAISLSIFYAFVLIFTGMCLDLNTGYNFNVNTEVYVANNLIAQIADSLGFVPASIPRQGYFFLLLVAVYVVVFFVAFIFEYRFAKVNNGNPFSAKMIAIYIGTLAVCVGLCLGMGLVIQNADSRSLMLAYVGWSVVVSVLLYAVLFIVIGSVLMFIVNLVQIDKPYKSLEDAPIFDDEDLYEEENSVYDSFDHPEAPETEGFGGAGAGVGGGYGGGGAGMGGDGSAVVRSAEELDDREKVFPSLTRIDNEFEGYSIDKIKSDELTLSEIATRFRNYLAKYEKLYFDIDVIRFFISGFAASHFEILEGLSGTGKSSLPRYFAKFVNGRALFMPVQATWRDKSNILGFFNEFSKTYSETEFLVELYRANYNSDLIHMFVLDEMNISRVEYYFADLLSVLEYPEPDWKLKILNVPHNFVPPLKLEDGMIQIPVNSYFVGTANKDDSTFTITDKVYDRAITTEFGYKNDPFPVEGDAEPIMLGNSYLRSLYSAAIENEALRLNQNDYEKFNAICEYVYDQFDIAIGNRILTQIDNICPVFVAAGGTKETVIDFMLSKKLIGKIEGRFEEYVKGALKGLTDLIDKTYGHGVLARTERTINSILRTL